MEETAGLGGSGPVIREAGGGALSRDIVVAAALMIVVRGTVFVGSLSTVWPVGGTATFALTGAHLGPDAPAVVEGLLVLFALGAPVVVAIGLLHDESRWRSRARVLGWAYVVDTVGYLGSIVIALYVWDGWSNVWEQFGLFAGVVVVNLPLLWLGRRIARRAR